MYRCVFYRLFQYPSDRLLACDSSCTTCTGSATWGAWDWKKEGVRLKIGASAHAFTNEVGHAALTGSTQVCTPIQAPSQDKPFVQAHSDVKAQTSKPAYPVHAVSLDALLDIDQHPVVDPEGLSHKTGGHRRAAAGTETHSDMEGLGRDSGILDEEESKRDKHHSMRTRCTHCPRKY